MKMNKCWSADFETTTDPNDCRVWAYSLCNVENPDEFLYGNSIEDFLEWCCESDDNYTLYFFNLKFDGSFIISKLLELGFTHIEDPKDKGEGLTFTTLITDMGQFYAIEIFFEVKGHKTNKVRILDAAKIFPNFSVERLAKSFGLPISKLELDYHAYREEGHILTQEEIDYIRNDVEIVARALKEMFNSGLDKMTIASDAMNYFKNNFDNFKKYFPNLSPEIDADIRMSYRGGFTYASDKYTEQDVGKGCVLDVNSLYPSCMMKPIPYGMPKFFEGEYEEDIEYPLYIITFTCKFKVKPDKIPCIQLKNNMSFIPNMYLKSSDDEQVTLTLTSVDYELFKDQYDFWDVAYHGGWKFKKAEGLFDNYINHWMEEKITAGKEGNKGKRQIAKLMLNSLY